LLVACGGGYRLRKLAVLSPNILVLDFARAEKRVGGVRTLFGHTVVVAVTVLAASEFTVWVIVVNTVVVTCGCTDRNH